MKEKTIIKTLRLKKSIVERTEELAKLENRSFTNYIETLLMRECE